MQDNVQFIIILAVIVLGAVLVARFWRTILKWLLFVVGVIVIIALVGLWLKNWCIHPCNNFPRLIFIQQHRPKTIAIVPVRTVINLEPALVDFERYGTCADFFLVPTVGARSH